MRIVYHHRTLGDGAEGIHVSAMAEAFRNLGHDVEVAAIIGEQTNISTSRTRALGALARWAPRPIYEAMELGYSLAGCRMLRRYIAKWNPDFLYERYMLFNIAGLVSTGLAGIPLVLEVNSPLAYERAAYESLCLRRLAQRCERFVCSRASLIVVVSTPLKDYVVEQGVPPERVVVLPNGTDPETFRPDRQARRDVRKRLKIPPEAVVVGFSGILRPWHGIELLIEAVAKIGARQKNGHVLIVGDGPSRASLEQLVDSRDLRRVVTFTGRVPHSEIPQYLAAFDIGVSPRATFYASPMKIPEYMATGMVVLAPCMPNIEDLITDGVDGVLFRPEDAEGLGIAIDALMRNAEHRYRIGQRARISVLGGRTWQHNATRVLERVTKVMK
jgi:glycosyltransferase involved in cell wall biosynthesis